MSSHSYSGDCPKCLGLDTLMLVSNNRPYPSNAGECINCGFSYWTDTGRMELKEVNEMREDRDLRPLQRLAKYKGE